MLYKASRRFVYFNEPPLVAYFQFFGGRCGLFNLQLLAAQTIATKHWDGPHQQVGNREYPFA